MNMKRVILCLSIVTGSILASNAQIQTSACVQYLMNTPKDVSGDFSDLSHTYFLADSITSFDVQKGEGMVNWKRYRLAPRQAFNLNGYWPVRMQMLDFPETQYDNDPNLRIRVKVIDERTLRITMLTTPVEPKDNDANDLMFSPAFISKLKGTMPVNNNSIWKVSTSAQGNIVYQSSCGTLEIQKYPFRLILKDTKGKILTQTRHLIDNDSTQVKLLPFNFIKRGNDNSRHLFE